MIIVNTVQLQDKKLYLRLEDKSKTEEITPFYSLALLTDAPLQLLNDFWSIGLIKDNMNILEYGEAVFYILRAMEEEK